MTTRRLKPAEWLTVWLAVGVAARFLAWLLKGGFQYPDEIFQQLEPAHHLRTGYAWLPWEFDRGLRSFILPYLYAGLMEILSWLDVHGLSAQRAITLHNALICALVVPAGCRMGTALAAAYPADQRPRAGLYCAACMALCPVLLYFAPHTLMGTPSLVCLTWGYAYWLEARAHPERDSGALLWMGVWLGLAGATRSTTGLHMLVPIADVLVRKRLRGAGFLCLGALPSVLLLGAVDWATWGRPFHSVIEHVSYNYLEGRASEHGVSPWHEYLTSSLWQRMGPLSLLGVGLWVLSAPRAWPLLLTAALPTALLSSVAHKEERFLMHNWPALAVAWGLGAFRLERWLSERAPRAGQLAAALAALLVLGSTGVGVAKLRWRWRASLFEAQDFVGSQPDATGLLYQGRLHLNGGYTVFHRNVIQTSFHSRWLSSPLFNYVALARTHPALPALSRQKFREVARFGEIVVLRR